MPEGRHIVFGMTLVYTLSLSPVAYGYWCEIFESHKLGITGTANQTVRCPLDCILSCIHNTQCYSVDVCVLDPQGSMLCQTNKGMVRDVTSLRQDSSCIHYRIKDLNPRYEACMSGSCYFFSSATLPSWSQAKDECESRDGHLIKVDNWDESDLVKVVMNGRYASYPSRKYSIGGYRTSSTGNFTWLDGTPLEEYIDDWDREYNQPDTQWRVAYYRQVDVYKWHDVYNSVKTDYICEDPYDQPDT